MSESSEVSGKGYARAGDGELDLSWADVVWAPPTSAPTRGLFYVDRELTWREWLRVRLLRRSDPRLLGEVIFGTDAKAPRHEAGGQGSRGE